MNILFLILTMFCCILLGWQYNLQDMRADIWDPVKMVPVKLKTERKLGRDIFKYWHRVILLL